MTLVVYPAAKVGGQNMTFDRCVGDVLGEYWTHQEPLDTQRSAVT